VLGWALAAPGAAFADDAWNHRLAAGLEVYLGVTPAALVLRAHPRNHTEAEMHDGAPQGAHAQHVMVAIFDAETGERVEDATVEARVTPLGLASVTRPLEPMNVADTVSYGNYFTMRGDGPYQIRIAIDRNGSAPSAIAEFSYQHRTR
jgi:hypothetical protein